VKPKVVGSLGEAFGFHSRIPPKFSANHAYDVVVVNKMCLDMERVFYQGFSDGSIGTSIKENPFCGDHLSGFLYHLGHSFAGKMKNAKTNGG
jgi:hypothetical protein